MNLEQVLTEQLQELQNMVEVLTNELNAIVARDHTALVSVVKNKTQILRPLCNSHRNRERYPAELATAHGSKRTWRRRRGRIPQHETR